jgi:hypothetical protein
VRNRTGISMLRIEAFRSRPLAVAKFIKEPDRRFSDVYIQEVFRI